MKRCMILILALAHATLSLSLKVNITTSDKLLQGDTLTVGNGLVTNNGQTQLVLQPDGNLVVYHCGQVKWSLTPGSGTQLLMQDDGNLVLYNNAMSPVWQAATGGSCATYLALQTDCNLVLYCPDNSFVWQIGAGCPSCPEPPSPTPSPTPSPSPSPPPSPTPGDVEICTGVKADASGFADASNAIQSCIDSLPSGGTLALPAGVYSMATGLTISQPMTLTTRGRTTPCANDLASCATLRARPETYAQFGFVVAVNTNNVHKDYIVLDGNRQNRLQSDAGSTCAGGTNSYGYNAANHQCDSCTFIGSVSMNALCGTGHEWYGADAVITDSLFMGNGDHWTLNMWSDGLTLNSAPQATVKNNHFIDNSDVNLILGSGAGATISGNIVQMKNGYAFAGIMLDNFNDGTDGEFGGAVCTSNQVHCDAKCHFGIQLGPKPWYPSSNIKGGTVTGNTVSGAAICIDIASAGTQSAPIEVHSNQLSDFTPNVKFHCGKVYAGGLLNIVAGSTVDRKGETSPNPTSVDGLCP